jgi:hypothetical protein
MTPDLGRVKAPENIYVILNVEYFTEIGYVDVDDLKQGPAYALVTTTLILRL